MVRIPVYEYIVPLSPERIRRTTGAQRFATFRVGGPTRPLGDVLAPAGELRDIGNGVQRLVVARPARHGEPLVLAPDQAVAMAKAREWGLAWVPAVEREAARA
jgi:hypothetical protein